MRLLRRLSAKGSSLVWQFLNSEKTLNASQLEALS
jgi:hypothetical protein